MKDVKMDDVRFVLERFFYGWKMNAIVFDADGKLVDFVMGTREKVDFSKRFGIIQIKIEVDAKEGTIRWTRRSPCFSCRTTSPVPKRRRR